MAASVPAKSLDPGTGAAGGAHPVLIARQPDVGGHTVILLSRADLADRWGLSLATVDRLRHDSTFPEPVRLGGSVRWREPDVEAWIEAKIPGPGLPRGRRKAAAEHLEAS